MVEGIQAYQNLRMSEYQNTGLVDYQMPISVSQKEKVTQEFMAIFYKELLKQAFKPPNLSGSKNQDSIGNTFGTDMFVEQMALELAQSKQFSASQLFPGAIERKQIAE